MYLTNLDEVVPLIRERLADYLSLKLKTTPGAKRIQCFAHDDSDPSMYFNPKTGYQTVKCFSCGWTGDIFAAAHLIENLPTAGPDWVKETVPHLAKFLDIPIQLGDMSASDKERFKLYSLMQDINDILFEEPKDLPYIKERQWENPSLHCSSIAITALKAKLIQKGWHERDLETNNVLSVKHKEGETRFFGEDLLTFPIRDYRGRPVAFISRRLEGEGSKYINTKETLIYEKRKTLPGLDIALKQGEAKKNGIYLVEGVGDLCQLYRLGIFNAAAVCSATITKEHASLLSMLGVNKIFLCLDWDKAGADGTYKFLKESLSGLSLNVWVVQPPADKEVKDPDSLLFETGSPDSFLNLEKVSAFDWFLDKLMGSCSLEEVCLRLIPIIAAEATAIKRELLAKILSEKVGVSLQSILADVDTVLQGKLAERRQRLLAATERYKIEVERDPENISAIMTQHEDDIRHIEKEYEKDVIGPNYQLARFDELQEIRQRAADGEYVTGFRFNKLTYLMQALSGGMDYTVGTVIYAGGRANSGKTATVVAVASDILYSDPDTIVLGHFTDDTYRLVEPRWKTNIAKLLRQPGEPELSIGMACNPHAQCTTEAEFAAYMKATNQFREYIASEKLVLIDQENGSTLSALEKQLRYIRSRYPSKKIFVVADKRIVPFTGNRD